MSSSVLRTLLNDFKYLLGEQRCCLDLFDGIIYRSVVRSQKAWKSKKSQKHCCSKVSNKNLHYNSTSGHYYDSWISWNACFFCAYAWNGMNRNDIHYVVHNRLNHDCSCSPRQQMKMRQRKIDNDYCYHGAGVSDTTPSMPAKTARTTKQSA